MKRIPQLDGLRGIAILLVLIWHYYVVLHLSGENNVHAVLKTLFSLSWSGVDLFFVLSGFLIGGSLLDNRNTQNLYPVFYTRRFFRIVPLYVILLIPFAVISLSGIWNDWPGMSWLFKNPMPLFSYATFTQNFYMISAQHFGPQWTGVTWSLAVEEQFYLVIPFLIRIIPEKRLPYFFIIGIFVGILSRLTFRFLFDSQYASYLLLPGRMDALLLGVLVAWIIRKPILIKHFHENKWFLNSSLIVLGTGILLFSLLRTSAGTILIVTIGATWISLFYAILILVSVTKASPLLDKFFSWKPLRMLGLVSYFVYLFHLVFLGLCHALIQQRIPQNNAFSDYGVTLLALVITLSAAALSYRFLEQPMLEYAHRVKYKAKS